MKIYEKNDSNCIQFDSKEEIDIFARFFYENDYFIRKNFITVENYANYISSIDEIFISNEYHNKLAIELLENIDKYKSPKSKLTDICFN